MQYCKVKAPQILSSYQKFDVGVCIQPCYCSIYKCIYFPDNMLTFLPRACLKVVGSSRVVSAQKNKDSAKGEKGQIQSLNRSLQTLSINKASKTQMVR